MKVNGVITCVLLLLCCRIGHTLNCYSCDYGTCLIPSTQSCSGIEMCGTETGTTGLVSIKKKGCINPLNCFGESSATYLGLTVTTTRSCCITNLCNSAVAPKVSIITGIAAMVALLVAKLS